MPDQPLPHRELILPAGTQIVSRGDIKGSAERPAVARGSVGTIIKAPADSLHSYWVRFPDGVEVALRREEIAVRKQHQEEGLLPPGPVGADSELFDWVIFRCVVGSRAYGLEESGSDIDRRGVYLPPAERHWSLYGVPEQIENHATEECYWELQKFLRLALKANPNVLECLYTPIVERATPLAEELLSMRSSFLSQLVYQTYNGYVMSQFKKLQQDLRNHGEPKWKHALHLVRLLLSGATVLREGFVPVRVEQHGERLRAIRRGEMPWEEVDAWRLSLHQEFTAALGNTRLPERPDYEAANAFLIKARRQMAQVE